MSAPRVVHHDVAAMTIPSKPPKMFETRSQAWRDVGLVRQISPRVVKRARLQALVLVPLFAGVVVLFEHRLTLFGRRVSAVRGPHGHGAYNTIDEPLDALLTAVTVIMPML